MYQGWGIRPGLSLKPVIPHLTDGGHQLRRWWIATATTPRVPGPDPGLGAVGHAGARRTRVLLDQWLLHLDLLQWDLPKQHQSKAMPDPHPAYSVTAALLLPFPATATTEPSQTPQRESVLNLHANSTFGRPTSQTRLARSHFTPPRLSHAESCRGHRPPLRPQVRPRGRASCRAPGNAPRPRAAHDASAPFSKVAQILDVKVSLKHRCSHYTHIVFF